MDFEADSIEVYFVEGAFKISQMADTLKTEAERTGGEFGLVIIDTGPVFYEGDDENNRTQQGRHAGMLRGIKTSFAEVSQSASCPLWVISRHRGASAICPLCPRKRKFAAAPVLECEGQTAPKNEHEKTTCLYVTAMSVFEADRNKNRNRYDADMISVTISI
jgi:hypothetical protein